ncbi:hypothetical protein ACFX13_000426 [Malus domestica]
MMLALFVMLTLVTYQTRTRQNPRMVMSLPLGISQYLGGPRYDPSCEIFESFQDSPYFTDQAMIHQRSQHQDILRLHLHQQSIRRLKSCKPIPDNLADLYTMSLPKSTFQKLVRGIGMPNYSYVMLVVLIWKLCQTKEEYPEVYSLDLNVLFFPTIRSILPTGFLLPN